MPSWRLRWLRGYRTGSFADASGDTQQVAHRWRPGHKAPTDVDEGCQTYSRTGCRGRWWVEMKDAVAGNSRHECTGHRIRQVAHLLEKAILKELGRVVSVDYSRNQTCGKDGPGHGYRAKRARSNDQCYGD